MRRYEVGDIVGQQFELVERLGGGASGEVFRAVSLIDDEEFALKFLSGDTDLDRVRREVRPLKRLDHPNIVKVVSAQPTPDGDWFIVQELVAGESLRQRLDQEGRLELDDLRVVGDQMLSALVVLHPKERRIELLSQVADTKGLESKWFAHLQELKASGVVHRDIKPENIMCELTGRVVLVDFGICSRAGTSIRTEAHTPGYVPPDFSPFYGKWSPDNDRYALGATLFEAAVGQLPTEVDDPAADLLDPLELNPDLPPDLCDFLCKACAPEEADRFATTEEMAEAWHALSWGHAAELTIPEPRLFEPWPVRRLPFPRLMSVDDLQEVVLEIVAAEGPVLCARLYDLVARGAVDRPTQRLNQLIYALVSRWNGPLRQVERLGGGQQNKTVYLSGTDPHVFRTLGERKLRHLPEAEFQVHIDQARRALGITDEQGDELEDIADVMAQTLGYDRSDEDRDDLRDDIVRRLSWGGA